MTNALKDGGMAFPGKRGEWSRVFANTDEVSFVDVTYSGLSVRDYFAAQALSALYHFKAYEPGEPEDKERVVNIARACYELADAMLAERVK